MIGKIIGTGSYLPKLVISNNDLAKIVETSDDWISSRTGISSRHIATDETTTSMAVFAAIAAMENGNILPENIHMILVATTTPDNFVPTVSCQVQEKIGAKNAVCMDLNAACSGFVYGMCVANAFIASGIYKNILLIGTENLSKIVDWKDRKTCVLFGDGAGAAIFSATDRGIFKEKLISDGSLSKVLFCKCRENHNAFTEKIKEEIDYIYMEGQEVFKFAVTRVPECIEELIEEAGVKKQDIKYYILHQANERILKSVAKRLSEDIEKFPISLNKYGNTSASSIPILLDKCNKEGLFLKGDKIIISGFGGGLTLGSVLIEW